MVKTIPPLSISLANLGTAPDQKVKTPSFLNIFAAHAKLFLYSFLASIDCILHYHELNTSELWLSIAYRVLIVSIGWVTYLCGHQLYQE